MKPPNWDNDCSLYIADETALMPEGWMVEEPEMIPDPLATRPSYWQDDEDGTWEAPMIGNREHFKIINYLLLCSQSSLYYRLRPLESTT